MAASGASPGAAPGAGKALDQAVNLLLHPTLENLRRTEPLLREAIAAIGSNPAPDAVLARQVRHCSRLLHQAASVRLAALSFTYSISGRGEWSTDGAAPGRSVWEA